MRFAPSVRSYLHLLVGATVLPFLGLVTVGYYSELKREAAHAETTVRTLAEMAAGGAGEFVLQGRRYLEVLAREPMLSAPEPGGRCRQSAVAGFPALHPEFASLMLIDASGRVVCTTISGSEHPTNVSVADRDWFRRIVEGEPFAIGKPTLSKFSGRWVVMLAHAARDEQGQLTGVVALAIDLVQYRSLPPGVELPSGVAVTLLTSDGTIVARSLEAETWVGKDVRATAMVENLLTSSTGVEEYTDVDGVKRLCGFSPVAGIGWTAVAGVPTDVAFADVRTRAVRDGVVLALAIAAATGLALVISRTVAMQARRLADAARALADGKLETRLMPAGPREMAEVTEQFNRMLDVRVRTEIALGESKKRLQALFDNIRDGILLVDSNARHVDVNPALCDMLGYSREEMLRMSLWDDVPADLLEDLRELWRKFLESGWLEGEFMALRKDGTTVDVEYRAVANFMPDLHLCSIRGITERRRLERERDALLDRLTLEFERMPMGCIVSDEHFRITEWNPAAEAIFGFTRQEVLGKTRGDVISTSSTRLQFEELREEMTRGRATKVSVTENLTKDGHIILCEWHDTPLYDEADRFIGMIAMARDITERTRAEEQLKRYAEQLKLLSRRLVEIQEDERRHLTRELHDRTGQNLTAINLYLRMICEQVPQDATAIRASANEAMALVDSTLEAVRDVMADLRPPVLEDYGLFAALQWYGDIFSRRTGLCVATVGTTPSPRLERAGETAMFRIAQEAFTNVVKHANATRIEVTLDHGSSFARLTVSDDGVGFDVATARQAGAGWGIMTMKERVEAVGGFLEVHSAPGRGTRIIAEIPNAV